MKIPAMETVQEKGSKKKLKTQRSPRMDEREKMSLLIMNFKILFVKDESENIRQKGTAAYTYCVLFHQ